MRLTCPNCDAQYEIEDRLIPENGRDVQCSSCGNTWFQPGAAALDEETGIFGAPGPTTSPEAPEFTETADAADASETSDAPIVEDVPHDIQDDISGDRSQDDAQGADLSDAADTEADTAADFAADTPEFEPPNKPNPDIDQALMDVLREEAERESRARAAETGEPFETQTDLGLDGPDRDPVQERTARLRGIAPEDTSDGSANSRGDLLPDIEEINSTLRATSERKTTKGDDAAADQSGKSGFRFGFGLILMLLVILIGVYVLAPQLKSWVPALADGLDGYVAIVDRLRIWLNELMELVIDMIGSSDEPPTDTPSASTTTDQ